MKAFLYLSVPFVWLLTCTRTLSYTQPISDLFKSLLVVFKGLQENHNFWIRSLMLLVIVQLLVLLAIIANPISEAKVEEQRIFSSNTSPTVIPNGQTSFLRTFVLDPSLLANVKQQQVVNNNNAILQTLLEQLIIQATCL